MNTKIFHKRGVGLEKLKARSPVTSQRSVTSLYAAEPDASGTLVRYMPPFDGKISNLIIDIGRMVGKGTLAVVITNAVESHRYEMLNAKPGRLTGLESYEVMAGDKIAFVFEKSAPDDLISDVHVSFSFEKI